MPLLIWAWNVWVKRFNKLLLALKIRNTLNSITVLSVDESLIKQATIPTAYTSSEFSIANFERGSAGFSYT